MLYQGELKSRYNTIDEARGFVDSNEEYYLDLIEKYSKDEVVDYIYYLGKSPKIYKHIRGVYCNVNSNKMRNTVLPLTFGNKGFLLFKNTKDFNSYMKECEEYVFTSSYGFTDNIDKFLNNKIISNYLNRQDKTFIVSFSSKVDVKNTDIYSRGKNGNYYGTTKGINSTYWYMFHIYEIIGGRGE